MKGIFNSLQVENKGWYFNFVNWSIEDEVAIMKYHEVAIYAVLAYICNACWKFEYVKCFGKFNWGIY